MLTGKYFRITRPTVGLKLVNGASRIVTVPADTVIKVISGPSSTGKPHERGLVYAAWADQTIAFFAIDIEMRGLEVRQADTNHRPDKSATA